jgi:peroxiredoxin
MTLQPGSKAPDFTLVAHTGAQVSLSSYRGKKVILAFHPASFTGGCQNQVSMLNVKYEDIKAAGADVIEISVDGMACQRAWSDSMGGIGFPILADFHPKAAVSRAYGVYNEERGTSVRSVFLIDGQGVIRSSRTYQPGTIPDAEEVLDEVKKMK